MAGRTDGLIKNFRATAAVAAFTIVKFGADDVSVVVSAAAADASIGVTIELDAAAGQRVDVAMSDIGDVRYGGNVARGDLLTSDGQGRAITAAPGAGVVMRTIGTAMVSAVLGDIGPMMIERGQIRG